MFALGLMELNLTLLLLVGGHPVMAPAHVAAGVAAGVRANLERNAPAAQADDVALVEITAVDGLQARGRVLACRTGDAWRTGALCPPTLFADQELRVFTGKDGVVGGWKVQLGGADAGAGVVVSGQLTAPLPSGADGSDALRTPLALLGESRHLVEPPTVDGYTDAQLSALLDLGKRTARMNRRMAEGMRPTQYALAPLSPAHPDAVLVAGTTYPEGDLAKAPRPSASLLFAHDPAHGGGDWARYVVVQVMSRPDDARKFERYAVAAILDVDGDGGREILVRGRSATGDRFRLFQLRDDELRFDPLADWAGAALPALAPTTPR